LTVNISLLLTIFIGIFVFSEPPMTAQMLLWINLVMDALAAIALGTEPPIRNIVKGNPREQTALLKQKQVIRQVIGVSVWNLIVMLLTFFLSAHASGVGSFSYLANKDLTNPQEADDVLCKGTPLVCPDGHYLKCPSPRSNFDLTNVASGKVRSTEVKFDKDAKYTHPDC
jgi:hypothetical protein